MKLYQNRRDNTKNITGEKLRSGIVVVQCVWYSYTTMIIFHVYTQYSEEVCQQFIFIMIIIIIMEVTFQEFLHWEACKDLPMGLYSKV